MIPKDLKYTPDHEWTRVEGTHVTFGITHHAQKELGDVVYLELPKVGAEIQAHQPVGVVESVKAVSDIFSPVAGKVLAVNTELVATPQDINKDPYGRAWMVKLEVKDAAQLKGLLEPAAYEELLKKTVK